MNLLFFYLFGIILTLPIYIIFPDIQFFFYKNLINEISLFLPFQKLLPISIFSLLIFSIIFSLTRFSNIIFSFLLTPFLLLFYMDLGLIFSLMFTLLSLFLLNLTSFFKTFSSKISEIIFKGSLHSLLFVGFGLIFDFIMKVNFDINLLYGLNSSYGYEIYSFYVTYSAVVILFINILLAHAFNGNIGFFKSILFISILFISLLASSRRAPLLEGIFMTMFMFVNLIYISNKYLKIRKLIITTFSIFLNFIYILWFSTFRPFTIMNLVESRGESNRIFFDKFWSMDVFDFFFGFEKFSFGGFSNIGLDLFARLGFFGVLVFILFFIYCSIRVVRYFYLGNDSFIYFYALCVSLIIGNLANLNLTQPYYISCLIAVLFFLNSQRKKNDTCI